MIRALHVFRREVETAPNECDEGSGHIDHYGSAIVPGGMLRQGI